MNQDSLKAAARDLCELRGVEPAAPSEANPWYSNEEQCQAEILKTVQLLLVIRKHDL